MNILTLNCWSHTINYRLFNWEEKTVLASGTVERVALDGSFITQTAAGRENYCLEVECPDHCCAISNITSMLTDPQHGVLNDAKQITAVGHRVAHGGEKFNRSVVVDDHILDDIRQLRHLAPLHNAPNISGIEAALEFLPDIPHVLIFDTAFHLTMPEFAYIYPLPYEWYQKYGVRRYGFHGPSHLYLSRRFAALINKPAAECNLITIHIDKGVSLCAIRKGESIDTSMGMTPLEGAVMDTRSGDIDPGITAFVMQELNLSAQEMEAVLNQKSGISGITGRHINRRQLLNAAMDGDCRAKLALEIESYRLRKYIGAYLAAVGPLDGIVFTSGTGETEWFARELVLNGLECLGILLDQEKNRAVLPDSREAKISAANSPITTYVIHSDEELVFAEDVAAILSKSYHSHTDCNYTFTRPDFVPLISAV